MARFAWVGGASFSGFQLDRRFGWFFGGGFCRCDRLFGDLLGEYRCETRAGFGWARDGLVMGRGELDGRDHVFAAISE
jgi:hypothetical protein